MLLGSSCSGDPIYSLKLYNPYSGSLHNVPKTAPDDEGVQTIVPERSSVLGQNGPNTVPIITYETPEDTAGRLLHRRWKGSGSRRYFKLDKGQSLPSGLGIKHDSNMERLSEKDLNRWTRATVSMRQEPEKYSPNKDLRTPKNCLQVRSENLGETGFNVKGFQEGFIDNLSEDPLFWVMLIALPIVYGSVHLAAWNFDFPTKVEKIMWRVACALVAGGIPCSLLIFYITIVSSFVLVLLWELAQPQVEWMNYLSAPFSEFFLIKPKLDPTPQKFYQHLLHLVGWIVASGIFLVVLLSLTLYFGARLFIIIESFISVRRLPLGVFITVNWSDYIPHL